MAAWADGPAPAGGHPSACIHRAETPPHIDGALDDEAWRHALKIDDLHQFNPVDHGIPTERTVFYLLYDDEHLYLGARLYDSEPEKIIARQLVQGQTLRFDDAIEILLDPFLTRRSGFWFQVNPNGIRRDGLYETQTEINRDWDGIWLAEARVDGQGWTAEVAIPFKTISFDEEQHEWGFNVARTVSRKKEEIAWSSFDRSINPGASGTLECISGIRQGRGLDVVPALAARRRRDFGGGASDSDFEPSLDIYYKVTPSVTAALTVNTDFSATEVDERQVNLTRFSLFFPEKRQFFNQDVDIFSFGGLEENGRPFFSRRIGLSEEGEPVDLVAGAKVTGKTGRWNIGFLDVLQDEHAGVDKRNVFVGRVAANVLEESSVGVILTDGNPVSNLDNRLVGADFRYRNTSLLPGRTVQGTAWYQHSDTEGLQGRQDAWGWKIESPNSLGWSAELGRYVIEENFHPAVGFVNRSGIEGRKAELSHVWSPNSRVIRDIGWKAIFEDIRNTRGDPETREFALEILTGETQDGDGFELRLKRIEEVLYEDFEIHPGVVIGPGQYEFDRVQLWLESAAARKVAVNLDVDAGDFYGGELLKIDGGIDWRPSPHLYLRAAYEYNDVNLPEGEFVTRLYLLRADVAFNSKWSWLNLLQYDNVSSSAGINSRLRYNPQAGQDLYLVVNRQFDVDPLSRSFRSAAGEVVLSLRYTFRY